MHLPLYFALLALLVLARVKETKYYDLLGISPSDFDPTKLRSIYSKLAKRYHPDKNPENREEAQKKFLEISQAFEVLSDDKKRETYNRYGEAGLKQEGGGGSGFGGFGGMDFADIFEQIFKQKFNFTGFDDDFGQGSSFQQQQRMDLQFDMKDLYTGIKGYKLKVTNKVTCPVCSGTGAKNPSDVLRCPDCQGHGIRIVQQHVGMGFIQQFQTTCQRCSGQGRIIKKPCSKCSGARKITEEEEYSIDIPAGAPHGYAMLLQDVGSTNVLLVIHTKEDPLYTRDGANLYHNGLTLSLREALLGFRRSVKLPDGSQIIVERTEVTQPGHVQIHPGLGFPVVEDPKRRGDLFIPLNVALPATISDNTRSTLQKVLPVEDLNSKSEL